MSDLLQSVRKQHQKSQADALAEYAAILARFDEPQKDDAAALIRLMSLLGINPDDVEDDARAVRESRDAAALMTPPDEVKAIIAELTPAYENEKQVRADAEAAIAAAEDRVNQAEARRSVAVSSNRTASDTIARCHRLNPRAFGEIAAAAPVDEQPAYAGLQPIHHEKMAVGSM